MKEKINTINTKLKNNCINLINIIEKYTNENDKK